MNKEEILRYMRAGSRLDDKAVSALVDETVELIEKTVRPKSLFRVFDCAVTENELIIGGVIFKSARLAENLAGCEKVAVLAATLGTEGDRLLRACSGESARLAAMQAALAAKTEEICDAAQRAIEKNYGVKTRSRFSPGYYDLDISEQKKLFSLVDITKRCGITLTDTFQMIPTKSVTAFVGIENEN